MGKKQPLDDDLEPFAAALGSLRPRPSSIDREVVLRELRVAGGTHELLQVEKRLHRWRLATAISTAASLILAVVLLSERFHQTSVIAKSSPTGIPTQTAVTTKTETFAPKLSDVALGQEINVSYIDARNRALADGVDQLQVPAFAGRTRQSTPPIDFTDLRFGG